MYCFGLALALLTLSCLSSASRTQYNQPCPLLGPVFPAPSNPAGSNAINSATKSATRAIQAALLNATTYGQLESNTASFSIDVYSTHERSSIFTYHYSAPALAHPAEGVATVDSNTIYRIGSVSKLLTVYTYPAAAGDVSFNEPVTKYIPELAAYATKNAAALKTSDIDIFDWNEITVGALASHMAGIVRGFAPNLASEASRAQFLGPVPDVNVKFCGNLKGNYPVIGAVSRSLMFFFLCSLWYTPIPSVLELVGVPGRALCETHPLTTPQICIMSMLGCFCALLLSHSVIF
jgi:CubicO group peptidase (beta-lactamase class C family)